ncbi:MAG: rod shape-determining protein MreC [Bacillota bacterium]|uniref:rod shape-determining protein MreC n=1 Tax=Desulforudis sp. DRI-14 TaxID=3459793 RepID=UPI0034897A58
MLRTWFAKALVIGILAGCLVGVMYFTAPGAETPVAIRGIVKDVFGPVEGFVMAGGNGFVDGLRHVFTLGNAAKQEALEERIKELEGRVARLKECELENNRLRRLLAYKVETGNTNVVVARVTGRDPNNWFSVVRLDKGTDDGLAENLPVIMPDGLVGRTINVTRRTADVLLITDPRSGVGAMIQQTRTAGVVKGVLPGSPSLAMSYLTKDAAVTKGQDVITSGLGGVFPKGIPVGRIVDVKRDPMGLTKTAEVKPLVDLSRLEEVMVLVGPPAGG